MKKQEIVNGSWDYLIILDACRYDYFKRLYKNYDNLKEGKLEKRKSRGSNTTEWLKKTFKEPMEDVTYISANPFINSKGMDLGEVKGSVKGEWNPKGKFKEIIDAWLTHWNEELNTVHPKDLTKLVKENKDKKLIVHYIQPHSPYITSGEQSNEDFRRSREIAANGSNRKKTKRRKLINKMKPLIHLIWERIPLKTRLKIKKSFGIELRTINKFVIDGKINELKQLYRKNLKIALEEVNKAIEHLQGKIVITADHGEGFGEQGIWVHPAGKDIPILREVPWLEINKRKSEKKRIKNHIKKIK